MTKKNAKANDALLAADIQATQKPQANEIEVLDAITKAVNTLAAEKSISQITMLGVINALRIEQENLFWQSQLNYRSQQNAVPPTAN